MMVVVGNNGGNDGKRDVITRCYAKAKRGPVKEGVVSRPYLRYPGRNRRAEASRCRPHGYCGDFDAHLLQLFCEVEEGLRFRIGNICQFFGGLAAIGMACMGKRPANAR